MNVVRRARTSVRRRIAERAIRRFEARFGSETGGYWYFDDHGIDSQDLVWYDPSDPTATLRALRRVRPTTNDVLIDIGSGKGRGLLVAGQLTFGRIIGLELVPELATVAEQVVATHRDQLRCKDFVFVASDALGYELPTDVSVVYMYCPFVGDVFRRFIHRLMDHADHAGHDVHLVYNYPFHHCDLIATGRFEVVDVVSAMWPPASLALAEVIVTHRVLRAGEQPSARRPRRLRNQYAARWAGPYDPGFVVERGPDDVRYHSPGWPVPTH